MQWTQGGGSWYPKQYPKQPNTSSLSPSRFSWNYEFQENISDKWSFPWNLKAKRITYYDISGPTYQSVTTIHITDTYWYISPIIPSLSPPHQGCSGRLTIAKLHQSTITLWGIRWFWLACAASNFLYLPRAEVHSLFPRRAQSQERPSLEDSLLGGGD